MNELITLDNLSRAKELIEIANVSQLKEIIARSEALKIYAAQAKKGLEIQNQVAEIKLRAEKRIGNLLVEMPKQRGARPADMGLQAETPSLSDLGIEKTQSHRWQTIASLPDDQFEQYVSDVKKSNEELTTAGIIGLAKDLAKAEKREERQKDYAEKALFFKEEDVQIWHGDFREMSDKISDESVDLILTDPPYPEEFLPLWGEMFAVADRVLKPSKFLVCYANHQNLDKIFQLANNLKYYWIFKLDFTMKPIAKGRNLIATWKPVLIFQKLPFKKIEETIEDTIKFDYSERDLHDLNWGQTIAPFEYLLDKFSAPNDLVFEPFAGSGTTLLACKNKQRRCIGIELEKKYVEITKGRLCGIREDS